jgi:hypothetical protein
MEWTSWDSLAFENRYLLPQISGIYLVADSTQFVWYVGQATNLYSRWQGKGHHRYPQLIRSHKKRKHRIFWKPCLLEELDSEEQFYINRYLPELNGVKVKTYLPKQPEVYREIKRVLGVISRPCTLFPTIRSIALGEYQNSEGIRSILIAVYGNDFSVLNNSAHKKYSQKIKSSWQLTKSYCGQSEDEFRPTEFYSCQFEEIRFEFIELSDFIRLLETDDLLREKIVEKTELMEVEFDCLTDLEILANLSYPQQYGYIYGDGKRVLSPYAYLEYRHAELIPLAIPPSPPESPPTASSTDSIASAAAFPSFSSALLPQTEGCPDQIGG